MTAADRTTPRMDRPLFRNPSRWIILVLAVLAVAILYVPPADDVSRNQRRLVLLVGLAVGVLLLALWLWIRSGIPGKGVSSSFSQVYPSSLAAAGPVSAASSSPAVCSRWSIFAGIGIGTQS